MKLVIDSSVFISHLGQNDTFTSISKRLFQILLEQKHTIVIPTIVVAETLTILKKQKQSNLKAIYNTFNNFDLIDLDKKFLDKYVDLLITKGSDMKTSDFIIAATAKFTKSTLITWDQKIIKSAKRICLTLTPKQYIEKYCSN